MQSSQFHSTCSERNVCIFPLLKLISDEFVFPPDLYTHFVVVLLIKYPLMKLKSFANRHRLEISKWFHAGVNFMMSNCYLPQSKCSQWWFEAMPWKREVILIRPTYLKLYRYNKTNGMVILSIVICFCSWVNLMNVYIV